MLWTMTKNNFKLMYRSFYMLILVTIAPIIVIAALSNAFDELLQTGYEAENVKIGYAAEDGSMLDTFLRNGDASLQESGIQLQPYSEAEGRSLLSTGEIDVLMVESADGIAICTLDEADFAVAMCRYLLDRFYTEYGNGYHEAMLGNMQTDGEKPEVSLPTEVLEGIKLADAKSYYGIAETVYFLWAGMLFLTAVVQSERKNRISQRYIAAPTNRFTIYLAKFIPCFFISVLSTCVSVALGIVFGAKWGNPLGTVAILLLNIAAGVAFGMLIIYVVKNLTAAIVLFFTMIWGMGFVGGSFETYMFSRIPQWIKELSPIYYVNRTLIEFSTMGHSAYTSRAVGYLICVILVCALFGCLLMNRRMEAE